MWFARHRKRLSIGSTAAAGLLIAAIMLMGIMLGWTPAVAQDDPPTLARLSAGTADGTSIDEPPANVSDDADAADGQVLDLPQAFDPANAEAASADPSDAGEAADESAASDPIGDADDYATREAANNGMPLVAASSMNAPPAVVYVPFPFVSNYAVAGPPQIIVVRPGFTAIPPTSPMLTTPSGSHAMVGGWWQRSR